MKMILRYANPLLLLVAIMAFGAMAGMAQNPCEDVDAKAALDAKFRDNYAGDVAGRKAARDAKRDFDVAKDLAQRKTAIAAGKEYLDKFGKCPAPVTDPPSADPFIEYLSKKIPTMETQIIVDEKLIARNALVVPFNAALNSKNWDDVYRIGKEILIKYPDELRDVELALGSIGYDESYKGNFKHNDETLRYARMSIADLESGKSFSADYGVPKDFVYRTKENALGWMNLTIGYIIQTGQRNKKDAQPYLYKATQANSETNKNPIPYELIGNYYFEELNKLTQEIKVMADDQKPDDTEEIAKAKVAAIKAKVALANGTAERAMDVFSRAYTLAAPTAAAKPYKEKMYKNVQDAFKLRFGKIDDLNAAWISSTVSKSMPNPTTPVTPIFDPEPVAPATPPTATSTTPPATIKPGTPAATTKPITAPGAKPVPPANGKPRPGVRPQANIKKPVAKKKAA
jgi:hypothetical protein